MEKENKNVNYNPFKMWGSYIGAILGFIVYLPYGIMFNWGFAFVSSNTFIPFICAIVMGFLIGWGIHSLIKSIPTSKK